MTRRETHGFVFLDGVMPYPWENTADAAERSSR